MSGSGKGLLGLWLYRSGDSEWAVKEGSPLHKEDELLVNMVSKSKEIVLLWTSPNHQRIMAQHIKIDSILRIYFLSDCRHHHRPVIDWNDKKIYHPIKHRLYLHWTIKLVAWRVRYKYSKSLASMCYIWSYKIIDRTWIRYHAFSIYVFKISFFSPRNSFVSFLYWLQKAEVFVDIECDPKHLEKVIRLLKREVRSVNYASPQVSDEFPPPTPLSACSSFG